MLSTQASVELHRVIILIKKYILVKMGNSDLNTGAYAYMQLFQVFQGATFDISTFEEQKKIKIIML